MKTIFILMQIKSFSQEEFCTKRPFEIESFWNSEMANYWEGPYSYIFKFSELSLSLVFIDAQIKVVILTIPEILKRGKTSLLFCKKRLKEVTAELHKQVLFFSYALAKEAHTHFSRSHPFVLCMYEKATE